MKYCRVIAIAVLVGLPDVVYPVHVAEQQVKARQDSRIKEPTATTTEQPPPTTTC